MLRKDQRNYTAKWLHLMEKTGFLLRFVKESNKFGKAGGYHLVYVSQGTMGVGWPWEEHIPNMAELEDSVVFDKRK